MSQPEHEFNERESLNLITQMIHKARDSYHDTGIASIMWGTIIAICSLVKLSEIQFNYRLPFDIYLLPLVAVIPQVIITIREKKERKVKSFDDAYMDYIWLGFGICIFLLIFIINVIYRIWEPVAVEYTTLAGHRSAFRFQEFIAPLFLMLYGLPTFITGAACRFRPMLIGGIFCWVCCLITIFTEVRIDLLLTAMAAIAAWLIPGLMLERDYRKAKKQEALSNV